MRWSKTSRRYKAGGYWRCAVKQREYDRRYDATAKGRARDRRYKNSPHGSLHRQLLELLRVRY